MSDKELIKQRKAAMREFLGKVVTEALSWDNVEGVSVRLVSKLSYEDHGYDGEVRLILSENRRYGYVFSAMELSYIIDRQMLIDEFRNRFIVEMNKPPG